MPKGLQASVRIREEQAPDRKERIQGELWKEEDLEQVDGRRYWNLL